MAKVELPLDIDHVAKCATVSSPWIIGSDGKPQQQELVPANECPACCYERGYLDARPWLKRKAKEVSA